MRILILAVRVPSNLWYGILNLNFSEGAMEVDEGVDTSDSDTSAVVIDYDETTSEGEDDISFVGTHQVCSYLIYDRT